MSCAIAGDIIKMKLLFAQNILSWLTVLCSPTCWQAGKPARTQSVGTLVAKQTIFINRQI